jgi:predicted AAA+ superfamily ATPase
MYNRLLKLPFHNKSSVLLLGPRGTGKTLWVKSLLPKALYFDLLEFSLYSQLLAQPDRLYDLIPKGFKDWIIIDEVQRVPELLNEVHRLIEHKHYKFVLTGSSARSLKRKGVNLLAGRALRYHMYPLTIQELKKDFNLKHALKFGLLPATFNVENPEKYLETYVQTYLREEVQQEGLTRNLSAFIRFLEVASFSQGSVLNMSEIAREVGMDRLVVTNYFTILEDLLLAYRIPPFTKRAKRRLILNTKFYFFDVGVYRHLRPSGILDTPEEIDGAALETLFLQSLKAVNDYDGLGYNIYYWRTSNGQEVDFIVYGPKGLHAFEIKRANHVSNKMLKGLAAFKNDYPEAKLYFIYTGKQREYHDDIQVIPIEEALAGLPKILTG